MSIISAPKTCFLSMVNLLLLITVDSGKRESATAVSVTEIQPWFANTEVKFSIVEQVDRFIHWFWAAFVKPRSMSQRIDSYPKVWYTDQKYEVFFFFVVSFLPLL